MKKLWNKLGKITNRTCSNTLQSGHPSVSLNTFRIPWKGYNNIKVKKKKKSDTLLIRKHQSLLNIHENLVAF